MIFYYICGVTILIWGFIYILVGWLVAGNEPDVKRRIALSILWIPLSQALYLEEQRLDSLRQRTEYLKAKKKSKGKNKHGDEDETDERDGEEKKHKKDGQSQRKKRKKPWWRWGKW